jgi:sialic acid synthase SpsE
MVKIIAEPANYWQGDTDLLHRSVLSAGVAGADFFKLQLYDTSNMGEEWLNKLKYYRQCELKPNTVIEVKDTAENVGMELLLSVFQIQLLEPATRITQNIKIPSGRFDKDMVAALKAREGAIQNLIISTGMIKDIEELDSIYDFVDNTKIPNVSILHCVSLYPPYDPEANMCRIIKLREFFYGTKATIGYSDHTKDNLASIVAASLGCDFIEMHFTIPGMFGKTSDIAFDVNELSKQISGIRRIETMMGDGRLTMQDRECEQRGKYSTRFKNSLISVPRKDIIIPKHIGGK